MMCVSNIEESDRETPGGQDGVARTDAAGVAGDSNCIRPRVHILQPAVGACPMRAPCVLYAYQCVLIRRCCHRCMCSDISV